MYHISRNCENCDFRIEKINEKGKEINVCVLDNKSVGLLHTCDNFAIRTGKHV